MPHLINQVLLGQYEAALSMLRDAIASCPPEHWDKKVANDTARFVAFHTLYCTDIYLSRNQAAFTSHEFVLEGRGLPYGQPLPKGTLPRGLPQPRAVEYVDFCIAKARAVLARESEHDLAGESGFGAPICRAEMHIYNIRHVQHHTGALAAHIRRLVPEFPEDGMGWIDSGTVRVD
ncbi:MAG: DinB family protein [Phycisphaeraceae bacterium]|nr:DinB family protein [Phycisphaerales bacterium]QOJ16742.1 MAG: DinB family protein [Phycisphaeraceae bacterium]